MDLEQITPLKNDKESKMNYTSNEGKTTIRTGVLIYDCICISRLRVTF